MTLISTRGLLSGGFAAVLGWCASASGQTSIGGIQFVDRAAAGQVVLGNIRGSMAVVDYDRDGWMDLVIKDSAGLPTRLFRNVPDPVRIGARTFADATVGSGLDDADGTSRSFGGVAAADVDNDGDTDVFMIGYTAAAGGSMGLLYRNDGNGHFTNVSVTSGVRATGLVPESASFSDFDHDGFVDLLVCCITGSTRAIRLLHNNGDGTFSDASGLVPTLSLTSHIYSHGWMDYDGDGWSDAFILRNSNPPALLRNVSNPAGGRMFVNVAAAAGFTRLGPAPMGFAPGDMDGDGDLDLAVTDATVGTYYRNNGNGTLTEIAPFATFFGWGITWIDADNDGDLDNYQAGSWSTPNADRLMRNLGGGQWDNASAALNTTSLPSQFAVQVDFNNDGRQDLITINPGSFISVYENTSTTGNHWLKVRLLGGPGVNGDAIGAVVRLAAGGAVQVRETISGSSTSSTEDLRPHYGLGAAVSVDRIEVVWPRAGSVASRTSVYLGPIAADQIITIVPRCPADRDGDGTVAPSDVAVFINTWASALSGGAARDGDWDGDGIVQPADVAAYVTEWFGAVGGSC